MSEQSKTCTELSRNEECGIGDEIILDLGLPNSEDVRQELLKGCLTGAIVEANLKLVEHSRAAEKVETNSKTLRKTNGSKAHRVFKSRYGLVGSESVFCTYD